MRGEFLNRVWDVCHGEMAEEFGMKGCLPRFLRVENIIREGLCVVVGWFGDGF